MHLTTSCPCEMIANITLEYDIQILSLVYPKCHPPYLVVLHFLLLLMMNIVRRITSKVFFIMDVIVPLLLLFLLLAYNREPDQVANPHPKSSLSLRYDS